jgi:F420-dependent oxidoreductase-like protein
LKVKFGLQIEPLFGFDYPTVEALSLNAERIGYDSLWFSDHLFLERDGVVGECLEAWSLLSAMAVLTEKVELGVLVTCNSYRHPSMLAKMAATVDVMSGGRLIFGIGAGWKKDEYKAYGIRYPPIKERMDRLEEALQLIRLLWTEERANFDGEYYKLRNAYCDPKPIRKPYPPILIGAHGEKRILRMVAKYGDMNNFSSWASERIEHLLNVLRNHCREVGRDYEEITKTFFGPAVLTEDEDLIHEYKVARARDQGKSLKEYEEQQNVLPGSWFRDPDLIVERYQHLVNLGFTHFQIMFPFGHDLEMSNRFAKEVIPRVS